MAELEKLELLSLVNSVTQELVNHTGLSGASPLSRHLSPRVRPLTSADHLRPHAAHDHADSTLAEFLIHLHGESKDFASFKQKCADVGAEFPDSFLSSVDRLILSMHPKYKLKKAASTAAKGKGKAADAMAGLSEEKQKQMRLFPGLAVPDSDWVPSFTPDTPDEVKERQMRMGQPADLKGASDDRRTRDEDDMGVDDLMAQLEGVRQGKRSGARDDERDSKRSRHRSPDYERRPDGDRYGGRDNGYGDRGRSGGGGGRYGEDDRGRYGRDARTGGAGPRRLDERPVLYKIYPGKIANVKDFGAFVTLEGVMGRVEGAFAATSAFQV